MLNSELQKKFSEKCRNCEWLNYCWGGCIKDRIRNPQDNNHTYFCHSYQKFFEHADARLRQLAQDWQRKQMETAHKQANLVSVKNSSQKIGRNEACPCGLLSHEYTLSKADLAFPTLVKNLLPVGVSGLVMAGLMGAVMSTIASLLTSSSSIFTFDIYKRHFKMDASDRDLIRLGRITTFVVLVTATIFGFFLRDLTAIFTYIQKYWSIAWPAVVTVFLA